MKILDGSVEVKFDFKRGDGYGVYCITVNVKYKSQKTQFKIINDDSYAYDEYCEFKTCWATYEDAQQYLYESYYEDFEEKIVEFCYNIDNN